MKALSSPGVCLIAALAAGCTFDASQLRALPDGAVEQPALPDAGAAGSGGDTASPPDAPGATGGDGDTAASSPDAPAATGGSGGSAAIGGSGGRGEIGASDASAAAGGVDAQDASVATGGTRGAGSVGVGAGGSSYIGASGITTSPFGGSGGAGGSGGSSGGSGGTVASGGVVLTGGIVGTGGVGTGGTTAACQESATQCSGNGLQTCTDGHWNAAVACSAKLVCERYPPTTCADPSWAEWPMPNDQVDVTAGAPNLESYTDNHDGTVTDNVTGLMWQQAVSTTTYTWAQAVAYCPTLSLASHSDWRLPSRIELVSIVDLGVTSGASINATYFPSTPTSSFWSSSPLAGSSSFAWVVFFNYGSTPFGDVSSTFPVRCVR